MTLHIPDLADDIDTITAALAYAAAGWYVLPASQATKHPGSVVGKGWPAKSSRDPHQIVAWFAGTNHSLCLHVGRSGAVVFDVDAPERIPAALAAELAGNPAPHQSTRVDTPGRGHHVYAQPPGRSIGNGGGHLGGAWGEVRGRNGVIVVAPSVHSKPEGRYRWLTTGPVPTLSDRAAALLPDQAHADDAVTDAEVAAFLTAHTANARPTLLAAVADDYRARVAAGQSRHNSAVTAACWAMREARAGLYPAATAATVLGALLGESLAGEPGRNPAAEWAGILAWAVAQAKQADPQETFTATTARTTTTPLSPFTPSGQPGPQPAGAQPRHRQVALVSAANIPMRAPRWLAEGLIPAGAITLLAGREGIGKSTITADYVSRVTRGRVVGAYQGTPRGVAIVATEDAWSEVIVPRLVAAGTDLGRVYRIDALDEDGQDSLVSVPADLEQLRELCEAAEVAMIVLDPIMSVIHASIDTHVDREARKALDPLARFAAESGVTVLGLIHVNKSSGSDPLNAIMGSRAFAAVARSVLFAMTDPESDNAYLFGHVKSNLGPRQATRGYELATYRIEPGADNSTADEVITTSRIVWGEQDARSIQDAMDEPRAPRAVGELRTRLLEWLTAQGRLATAAEIKAAFPGENLKTVDRTLARMAKDGTINRPLHGHYVACSDTQRDTQSTSSSVSYLSHLSQRSDGRDRRDSETGTDPVSHRAPGRRFVSPDVA